MGLVGVIKSLIASALAYHDYYQLAGAVAYIAIGTIAILYWHRRITLSIIKSEDKLHAFAHNCRDDLARILDAKKDSEVAMHLNSFQANAVTAIAAYFRHRKGVDSYSCAIRLASEQDGETHFVTRVRSESMQPIRQSQSIPLRSCEGLARALLGRDKQGVYLITDIDQAVEENVWVKTKNDLLTDVKTVMAAPINGYRDGQKFMLGILYVNSSSKQNWLKSPFQRTDSIPIKAFADTLGALYTVIWDKMERGEAKSTLANGKDVA